jgi:hypothetical protein
MELARLTALARQSGRLVSEKNMIATPRESWPQICEHRLHEDIRTLQRMTGEENIAATST